ncbi:MAG TPA: hypothetical protein VMS86_00950 [Thermoanaerobaculia bacterium]|nr:hypothetical protein [Thermoanaerobaculia bacterium]
MPGRKVLVLGSYRQTVTVVRSLARAGYAVVVGRHGRRAPAELSRFTSEVWIHPDPENRRRFADAVVDLVASRPGIGYVFPVSEIEIQPLTTRGDLGSRAIVVVPGRQALETCLDKRATYAIARELGVPLPETRIVTGRAELERAVESIGFPCVIKRPDSIVVGGKKAVICGDRSDLETRRATIERERGPLVLQAWVSGHRHNCQFAAREGEILTFFQQKVLRTDEVDGTGLGVDGVSVAPSPELRSYCDALVARLRYTGVGCIQFLVDESTGATALLEWNPRLDATCDLPFRCGIDFPLLALRLAESGCAAAASSAVAVPDGYPAGRRIYWLAGDLNGLLRGLRARDFGVSELLPRLLTMGACALRREYHLGWSWRDPMPTVFSFWRAARRELGRLAGRRSAPRGERVTGVAR